MIDVERLVAAILSGPLPPEPFIAALPMYDWPEVRAETDALWVRIRNALRAAGVNAPEALTRRNGDMPGVDLSSDEFDLPTLWRHPNLLLAMTCWGPMELGLATHVRVVGQTNYGGVEGGAGEDYSSAIVMRRDLGLSAAVLFSSAAPPSALPGISSQGVRLAVSSLSRLPATFVEGAETTPLENLTPWGEMPGRAEGGAALATILTGKRLAYSSPDSMSGHLALQRDLEAQGSDLHIFASLVPTGGHRNSIRAVAEGRADVATIDCRSWQMAQRFERAARELRVVGWTERRLGLPVVMARG